MTLLTLKWLGLCLKATGQEQSSGMSDGDDGQQGAAQASGPGGRWQVPSQAKEGRLVQEALEKMSKSLWEQAVEGSKLADVRIRLTLDSSTLHAHRSVLCARSSVFNGMFMSDMEEARTGEVKISEVSHASFRCFLQFLYTGAFGRNLADGRELWGLADLYEVDELKRLLLVSIDEGSIGAAVRFASDTGCTEIAEACCERAASCLARIDRVSLVGMSVDEAKTLMSSCQGGLDRFKFAERWFRANDSEIEGVQSLVQDIDLTLTSSAELLSIVKPSKLLSAERLNEIYERRLRSQEWATGTFSEIRKFGGLGNGPLQFNRPTSVALTVDGSVVVVDQENCRIQTFGLHGQPSLRFGSRGDGFGRFLNPVGVATDLHGHILVCDHDLHQVQKFRSNGQYVTTFGKEGSQRGDFLSPRDLAVNAAGEIVVCDKGNNRIQVLSDQGVPIFSFGTHGEFMGQFQEPCGVDVGPEGNFVVADSGNARIQIFKPDGAFLSCFGERGDEPGKMQSPDAVAFSPQGDIVVSDWRLHRVSIFRMDGTYVQCFGAQGEGDAQFQGPAGVSVSINGSVIIADQLNHRVAVWGKL